MNTRYGGLNHGNYQGEPEKVNAALSYLEQRATDAKNLTMELLMLLDLQEKVPWPDMLDKFAALSGAMSQLQSALKKSALQNAAHEDHGALLRSHVLVPQNLSLEIDPLLQQNCEMRVHSWNHDVVPDYLRTKMNPEMEEEEKTLDQERSQKQQDHVQRQIVNLNKHVDILLSGLQATDKQQTDLMQDQPTFSREDTTKLVRAILLGEGLPSQRAQVQQAPPSQVPPPQSTAAPPPQPTASVTIRR